MTHAIDLEAQELEFRKARLSRLDPFALVWFAALPEWTDSLADQIGFPPSPTPGSREDLLQRLENIGFLERRTILDESGQMGSAFWLPASRRADFCRHVRDALSPSDIYASVLELGKAVAAERREDAALQRWRQVVAIFADERSGLKLLKQVDDLLERGSPQEALSLVAAAQSLGDLLGETLASAARRAQWRIDRGYRQALDARALVHYLPRQQVEQQLRNLVSGEVWALHLLGDGGVGKTMAVSDLASGGFAMRNHMAPFPVARVDFDHLDPRYPQRRPAELLLALTQELTQYSTTRDAENLSREVEDAGETLHEALVSRAATSDAAMLDNVLNRFAAYLDSLGTCVVLVLDTCEELAKLHAPKGRAPAVDHTFGILERIQKRSQSMRVLLAGRRWLVPPPEPERAGGPELDPRPYLRVERVGGFTTAQALGYLDLRDPDRQLSQELRTALISRSGRGGAVNPFDLAGYCDWALAEPDLDPNLLRTSTGDPYIEQRIIARLPEIEVRDCLPVAVELGRFDKAMITPYLMRRRIDTDTAFSGLIAQEWVSAVTFDSDGRPLVIEVDDHIRVRLRDAVRAQPERFPLDRVQLGRDLAKLVDTVPIDDLAPDAVECAVRLLPLSEGAAMWSRLEQRIADTDAWGWAMIAVPRAAAAEIDRADDLTRPTMMAAIQATQAAAVLRQQGRQGIAGLWREVVRLASRHPDPTQARLLRLRGICGQLASDQPTDESLVAELSQLPTDLLDDAVTGAVIAALDAMTARHERLPGPLAEILHTLESHSDPNVCVTAGLAREADALRERRFAGYLESALSAEYFTNARRWVDWLVPPRLVDRVRLARMTVGKGARPDEVPIALWRSEAIDQIADIDAERLVAATIVHELNWRLVDRAVLDSVTAAEQYEPHRRPTHPWHRLTPSLHIAVNRARAAAGDPDGAAKALRNRRRQAVSFGEDPATVADCDSALLDVCRVYRTTKYLKSIHRLARSGSTPIRTRAWAALALAEGRTPDDVDEAGDWHIWWRTQIRRPGENIARANVHLPPTDVGLVDTAEYSLVQSDTIELETRYALVALIYDCMWDQNVVLSGRTDLGEVLRADALLGDNLQLEHLMGSLPHRLVAEAALAEGELLALRLPETALTLLRRARELFVVCGDERAAYRSSVLMVLTSARAGRDVTTMRLQPEPDDLTNWAEGWRPRCHVARKLVARERVTPLDEASGLPETDSGRSTISTQAVSAASVRASIKQSVLPTVRGSWPAETTKVLHAPARRSWPRITVLISLAAAVATTIAILLSDVGTALHPTVVATLLAVGVAMAMAVAAIYYVDVLGGAQRWRYRQRSIGYNLEGGSFGWSLCAIRLGRYTLAVDRGRELPGNDATPDLKHLRSRTFFSRRPYVLVPLLVPRHRSELPWEQRFCAANRHLAGRTPMPVRLSSTVARLAIARPVPSELVYLGPEHLNPEAFATRSNLDEARAVHFVGTPVRTSAGCKMRVRDLGISSSLKYGKSGRGTYTGEQLVGPSDLLGRRLDFVVLQCEPVDGPPRPLGDLRPDMCEMAAEFADAGAKVLVVPPLPDIVAAKVAGTVHYELVERRGKLVFPGRILDLAYTVRSLVARREESFDVTGDVSLGKSEMRAEWDVLLFV